MKNILISTGGSGGHVVPAKILREHLQSNFNIFISTDLRGLKYLDDKKNDIVLLQLDWTKKDPNIKNFLISKNRYGIPFNEIYNYKFKDGLLLPELLNKKQLIKLLNQ